jgi:hypothetical protein
MRTSLALLSGACLLSLSSMAWAQGECPPGGWFCDEEESSAPAQDDDDADDAQGPSDRSAPPIVVYEPADKRSKAPDKIIVVDRAEDAPRPAKRRKRREWGFNLRLEGVLMGDNDDDVQPPRHPDAGMAGLGFSFRYRPIPHFAFDAGLDFLTGEDWHGNRRSERALLLSGIIFFNPRDKLQVYTLGGLGFSSASVLREHDVIEPSPENYSYFGGHLGLGLEFRVGRKTALNVDVLGFLRGRTDDKARHDPEFVDPVTNRATNTSGGGLFRGGITFYW